MSFVLTDSSINPIDGEHLVVLHCFWVLRKAKGHRLGVLLIDAMRKDFPSANGFATIGLEQHWSPWLKKTHMERYDFVTIDSLSVSHKIKHTNECFIIHLMWRAQKTYDKPTWDKSKLLQGIDFCMAHPLYHPQHLDIEEILQPCNL